MHELVSRNLRGEVRIFDPAQPETTLFEKKNVIVNGISYLFARLLAAPTEPFAGVWGLAIGQGGTGATGWSANQQPDPVPTATQMVAEIKRKQLSSWNFVDANGNPTTAMTTQVDFITILNATTDGISIPIREMGLIGGGTTSAALGGVTDMLTAPYFTPQAPAQNSVLLINYLTLPPYILPPSTNQAIRWRLQF